VVRIHSCPYFGSSKGSTDGLPPQKSAENKGVVLNWRPKGAIKNSTVWKREKGDILVQKKVSPLVYPVNLGSPQNPDSPIFITSPIPGIH
jgi:hypothetical protein